MKVKVVDYSECNGCNVGMNCAQYGILAIAGPFNLPLSVKLRMIEHKAACHFHNSLIFKIAASNTIVTKKMEKEALKVAKKLKKDDKFQK